MSGKDVGKHVLQLMDVLFTKQQMSQSCLIKANGKSNKPALLTDKVKLIEGKQLTYVNNHSLQLLTYYIHLECVEARWGKGTWANNISKIRSCANQKCLDQLKIIKATKPTLTFPEESTEH